MTGVFLDTVGLIAASDANDQWHAATDAAYHVYRRWSVRGQTEIVYPAGRWTRPN